MSLPPEAEGAPPRDGYADAHLGEPPWGPGVAVAIFAGCTIAASVVAIPFVALLGEDLAIALPVLEVLMLVALWWVIGTHYGQQGYGALLAPVSERVTPPTRSLLLAASAAAALFVIDLVAQGIVTAAGVDVSDVQREIREVLLGGPVVGSFAVLTVVLFAPVVEELFFRGLLFQGFARRWGAGAASVMSSGIFAAFHIEPTAVGTVLVVGSAFLLGLVSCWLFMRTRTLLAPVALHVFTNAAATLELYIR